MQLPVLALVIALLSFGSAYAAEENAEENAEEKADEKANLAHGIWMTDLRRSKVKVGQCDESDGLCTEIVWLREPNNSRGVPLTDGRNQNPRLRKRPIMGLKILEGLKQIGRYEWEGSVYNPEDGKTYKANLALVKPNRLRLKGCMPMGWPCRSKIWTRSELDPPAPVEIVEESVEVVEESVEVTVPGGASSAAGGATQPQPQPPTAAPASNEVQTASREAPVTLTPPAQNAPPAVTPQPAPAPQQRADIKPSQPVQSAPAAAPKPAPESQPMAQLAPAATPPPAPVAPSKPAALQSSRRAYEPPSRTVAAPPPPPPAPVAPAQPQRQAAVVEPPPAPTARVAAPPPPPPAVVQQEPARPDVYPDVAALPSEPAVRRGGDGSNYLVQVAARQDRDEAVAVFNDLRRRYPRLLGNAQPIIKRVNLGELGVWYRVRVGPIAGKAAALSLCNRLKFAGSDCFIRRQ